MDRNYYYEKMAEQREREIADLLSRPREESRGPLNRKQAGRLVLRVASAIIVLSLLALYLI